MRKLLQFFSISGGASAPAPGVSPNTVFTDSQKRNPFRRVALITSVAAWLTIVGIGLIYVWSYEAGPGLIAPPPAKWPSASSIQLERDRATLVMAVHPQCPCSRASIEELAAIMAHCEGRLNAYVLFMKPEGTSEDWEKTDLWRSAAKIPGVNLVSDVDVKEAARFNAATSGTTLLYDPNGQLIFSGGITGSRGHSGDNLGRSAIVSLVNREVPEATETAVYGCPLFDPANECRIPRK
jgi:hypothetical protein